VVRLLGWAWVLAVVGATAASAADRVPAGQPVLLAQARVPILAQAQPPRQQPRLISLDFKDADINNILRILSEFSGLNIVTSEDVKGKVTVKLANVPWQAALESVVRAAKLAYVQEGNIIRVDKLENLTKEAEAQFKADQREIEIQQRRQEARLRLEEQQAQRKIADERAALELAEAKRRAEIQRQKEEFELAEAKRKADLEAQDAKRKAEFEALPLVEEVVALKYANVGARRTSTIDFLTDQVTTQERRGMEETIRGVGQPGAGKGLLSPRGELTADPRTNSLVIRDVPDNLAKIKEFIAKVDRPAVAIQIEARVVEIGRDDARSLGVIWGGAFTPRASQDSPIVAVRGSDPAAPPERQGGPARTGPSVNAANFPAAALTAFPGTAPFGLALGWLASNFALDIQLQALEGQGRARIVASPSLITLDNEAASIASGRQEPVITITSVSGAPQPAITFKDVTTRLQVTPRFLPGEGKLLLGIGVKRENVVDRINTATISGPVVATRQTNTQVEIPDGGTVVISGLREDITNQENTGVPWLSRIPVLGWLFKNDLTETSRRELVVFLTAKVVQNPGQASVTPEQLPAAPGTPVPPAPTGQAPAQLPAVSSATPEPPRPELQPRVDMSSER
jgi:type IV pilus secretin PilQ/predicted competence protein